MKLDHNGIILTFFFCILMLIFIVFVNFVPFVYALCNIVTCLYHVLWLFCVSAKV